MGRGPMKKRYRERRKGIFLIIIHYRWGWQVGFSRVEIAYQPYTGCMAG
jgi:hypothetical protein